MSLDRHVREGFSRITSPIEPDVDRHLHEVVRDARRRVMVRRASAAAVIAAVVLVGPRALDSLRDFNREPRPAQPPGPTISPTTTVGNEAIAGTYHRTVPAGDAVVRQNHLAGRWTIELRPDGTMVATAPASFVGVLSGLQFRARADTFGTNLFIQDLCSNLAVPVYRWTRVGDQLTFTPVSDPCTARVAVLSSGPWASGG
jgi:hypothetical protein